MTLDSTTCEFSITVSIVGTSLYYKSYNKAICVSQCCEYAKQGYKVRNG